MLYYPEGTVLDEKSNQAVFENEESVRAAIRTEKICEGRAICCDEEHNLLVSLPKGRLGIIKREDGALGIKEGSTRDIAMISRVSKSVCFTIIGGVDQEKLILSRVRAQQLCRDYYISKLRPGEVIPAIVTHFESYGSFVDIGCGIPSLIPIDSISVSRISHPSDRFVNGQNIFAAVKAISKEGKICLTHKELLGTWMQNAEMFNAGETVCGIVRSITDYGIFIELAPNLAGLAEIKEGVEVGDSVSVFIKSLIPDKMKVKLAIVDAYSQNCKPSPLKYYIKHGRLKKFRYSPVCCERTIETDFTAD